MERVYERCCGLDVHKETVVACLRVPGERGRRRIEVRTFGTTTPELLAFGDWLTEQVYRWGRTFTPQELLLRATGSQMDPEPYVRYLGRKLNDLVGTAVA